MSNIETDCGNEPTSEQPEVEIIDRTFMVWEVFDTPKGQFIVGESLQEFEPVIVEIDLQREKDNRVVYDIDGNRNRLTKFRSSLTIPVMYKFRDWLTENDIEFSQTNNITDVYMQ